MGQQKEALLAGKLDEGHLLRFLRGVEAGSSLGLLPGRITPEGKLGWEGAAGVGAGIAFDPLTKVLGALKLAAPAVRGAELTAAEAPKAVEAIHLLAPEINTVIGTARRSRVPEALSVAIPEGLKGAELASYLRKARRMETLKQAGVDAFDFVDELLHKPYTGPVGEAGGAGASVQTSIIRNLLTGGAKVGQTLAQQSLDTQQMRQAAFERNREADQKAARERQLSEQRLKNARSR